VAAVVGKKVTVLTWPDGARSWPSVVSFPSAHEIIVGAEARRRLATDPAHTVASPKRLLGRKYDDKEIQSFLGQAPYRTVPGPDGSVVVEIWGQQYAVTQLCAYIVEQARKVAETHLGCEVHRCVMTVPVSFDEQRARIFRRAAELAQLEVLAMIDEPSAAALANRFDPNFGGIVGVYDFGGGTFDFSIVDVSRGDFQVLATAGDTWLGGDDFDAVLAEAAANQFWRMHKVDLRKQAVEWQKLVFACERAKRALTVDAEARIHVPEVLRSARGMVDLDIRVDRATFERACRPVIERSLATCDEALELLDMKRSDLSTIYLSGGTTYIPAVRQALAAHFGVPVRTGVPPEHAVCLGAAIHAAQLQFQSATTLDAR
ncbi:MAG: Hsp70 family protein, partial [Deltaproteobacteria bacterium]